MAWSRPALATISHSLAYARHLGVDKRIWGQEKRKEGERGRSGERGREGGRGRRRRRRKEGGRRRRGRGMEEKVE